MRPLTRALLAAALVAGVPAHAQQEVPEIKFDSVPNALIAKFDKDGRFVKSWGKKGTAPGEFANVRSIAVDVQGNVYAADGGNKRVQVFDNDGNFKTAFAGVGHAQALCMTKGTNPALYV